MSDRDAFLDWFGKEATGWSEDRLLFILKHLKDKYLEILLDHWVYAGKITASMVKLLFERGRLKEMPPCACGHLELVHADVEYPWPTGSNEDRFLKPKVKPETCGSCRCRVYADDNLKWLEANHGV